MECELTPIDTAREGVQRNPDGEKAELNDSLEETLHLAPTDHPGKSVEVDHYTLMFTTVLSSGSSASRA